MNKKSIIFIAVGVVLLVVAFVFLNQKPESKTPTDTTSTIPQTQDISVDYKSDGKFTPQSYQVREGSQVKLKITSDIADELHFHGYDLSIDLEANQSGQIEFTATQTGRFEFELENHKITLGAIEVYPK